MKTKWEYVVNRGDTADGILSMLLRQRTQDIRTGNKRKGYSVREFRDSFHNDFGPIPNSTYAISSVTLDKIAEQLNAKEHGNFDAVCKHIQIKLGLPFIKRPVIPKDCQKRLRSPEEINTRLRKLDKKLSREAKDLNRLCGDGNPPVSSRMTGAYNALRWVFNGGNIRAWSAVLQRLYEQKIEQERDRLFHVRRHESDRSMNNCFDEEINGAIAELSWVLVDNPFSSISMPGLQTYPVPYQNETFVEHDE